MNKQFKKSLNNLKGKNLEELLEEISVQEIEKDHPLAKSLLGWYGVATDLGIIAVFGEEKEAFKFRLDYINRLLNN
jgi:hypothetical protein